jgi:CheY-like chemotaxis protein
MLLKRCMGDVQIKAFVAPERALEYIVREFSHIQEGGEKITIFLDINMPILTGWEFLDKFDRFTEEIKKQFNIYILSSSIDPADIHQAKLNPLVRGFIEKPLTHGTIAKSLASLTHFPGCKE